MGQRRGGVQHGGMEVPRVKTSLFIAFVNLMLHASLLWKKIAVKKVVIICQICVIPGKVILIILFLIPIMFLFTFKIF